MKSTVIHDTVRQAQERLTWGNIHRIEARRDRHYDGDPVTMNQTLGELCLELASEARASSVQGGTFIHRRVLAWRRFLPFLGAGLIVHPGDELALRTAMYRRHLTPRAPVTT